MTRTDFIRHFVLRHFNPQRPKSPSIDRLVKQGERLWQRLGEAGIGEREKQGPRPHVDWYGSLSDQQRQWFDRFWQAFDYKDGKQGAAMRWAQINPDETTTAHIIHAAAGEARARAKRHQGQTPIMAQGWLNQRRWEDYDPPQSGPRPMQCATHDEVARLRAEIAHLNRLLRYQENSQLREQRDGLADRLAALKSGAT